MTTPRTPGTPLARLDPRTRVLLALIFTLGVGLAASLPTLMAALGAGGLLAWAAGLRLRAMIRRIVALEGFMVAAVAILPFTVPGVTVAAPAGLDISAEGLAEAGRILVRANAASLAVMALIGTMAAATLGHALARLGVPRSLVRLLMMTWRYIHVLDGEYRRLRLAMRARAFRARAGLHTWASLGTLFGMLLIRSLERAERIDAAMRCRGFTGHFPSLEDHDARGPAGWLDWSAGAVSAAAVVLIGGLGL